MKQFRTEYVLGWKIVESNYKDDFENQINELMEMFNFEDFQFSTVIDHNGEMVYTGIVLLQKKGEPLPDYDCNFCPATTMIGIDIGEKE